MTKKNGKSVTLAKTGDPYVDPATGKIIQEERDEYNHKSSRVTLDELDPETYRSTQRRILKDLKSSPRAMNAVGVIFMYTMLGVSDAEIADAVNISRFDVQKVRESAAYAETFMAIHGEIVNADSICLRNRIASYAGDAVEVVKGLMHDADKDEIKLKAAKDLLDRGGQEAPSKDDSGELRISIVNEGGDVEVNISGE